MTTTSFQTLPYSTPNVSAHHQNTSEDILRRSPIQDVWSKSQKERRYSLQPEKLNQKSYSLELSCKKKCLKELEDQGVIAMESISLAKRAVIVEFSQVNMNNAKNVFEIFKTYEKMSFFLKLSSAELSNLEAILQSLDFVLGVAGLIIDHKPNTCDVPLDSLIHIIKKLIAMRYVQISEYCVGSPLAPDYRAEMLLGDENLLQTFTDRDIKFFRKKEADDKLYSWLPWLLTNVERVASLKGEYPLAVELEQEYFLSLAKTLLSKGVNCQMENDTMETGMHLYEDPRILDLLNTYEPDSLNAQDQQYRTPLMKAAQCKKADKVRWLIDHGARIEIRDSKGMSALNYIFACLDPSELSAILSQLLKAEKVPPILKRFIHIEALEIVSQRVCSCTSSAIALMRVLVENGANPTKTSKRWNLSPLAFLIDKHCGSPPKQEMLDLLEYMCEKGNPTDWHKKQLDEWKKASCGGEEEILQPHSLNGGEHYQLASGSRESLNPSNSQYQLASQTREFNGV